MLQPADFFATLRANGVRFFTGVPDSLLKHFCAHVTRHAAPHEHVIAANEGAAVALAAGHFLGTGRPGLVYMQNSGQGNAVNPLASLVAPDIFGIPMLLLIGWRGEPGVPDEPQHVRQGRCTTRVMDALELPYEVLPRDPAGAEALVTSVVARAIDGRTPYGLIVRDRTFAPVTGAPAPSLAGAPTREEALRTIVAAIPEQAVVVCTTGMASRELFEIRRASGAAADGDFRVVGSMGHASQIALGIALSQPSRPVVCLDGDGAVLMHMGALAIIGTMQPRNLVHVVINNGAHDSVGGQPTAGLAIDLCTIARACGYAVAERLSPACFATAWNRPGRPAGTALFEVLVTPGARADLGRPSETPSDNRDRLMRFLGSAV